jgi:hypothetical protein
MLFLQLTLCISCLFLIAIMGISPTASNENNARVHAISALRSAFCRPVQNNAITDVAGCAIGHTTIIRGDNVRTGVTAIVPHGGNLFSEKVPGAVFVGNGFGKLAGSTQVNELGEIETPILLTSTLSVPKTADFLIDYMLALPGNEKVRSINPLVAETNDGGLNDIRGRHITREDVFNALKGAKTGRSMKAQSAPERAPSRSAGKAASAPLLANSPNRSADTPSAFSSNQISAAFSRSTASPSAKNSGSIT